MSGDLEETNTKKKNYWDLYRDFLASNENGVIIGGCIGTGSYIAFLGFAFGFDVFTLGVPLFLALIGLPVTVIVSTFVGGLISKALDYKQQSPNHSIQDSDEDEHLPTNDTSSLYEKDNQSINQSEGSVGSNPNSLDFDSSGSTSSDEDDNQTMPSVDNNNSQNNPNRQPDNSRTPEDFNEKLKQGFKNFNND
jgi:hypothetical protein